MATSSQITSDPGEEVAAGRIVVGVPGKSFIVGKYDEDGRRKADRTQIEDNKSVAHVKKLMVKSMSTRGGELMPGYVMTENGPTKQANMGAVKVKRAQMEDLYKLVTAPAPKVKGKPGRKKKVVVPAPAPEVEPEAEEAQVEETQTEAPVVVKKAERQTFPVVFHIESGTIKSMADAFIECKTAILLVYRDRNHVSYEPKAGNKLEVEFEGKKTEVMYLGMMFEWYETAQQLMVFLKTEV